MKMKNLLFLNKYIFLLVNISIIDIKNFIFDYIDFKYIILDNVLFL